MYQKIKVRIATNPTPREDIKPYETVAMQPAEIEEDFELVDKKVLQRYGNQQAPIGFQPDESIRQQRQEKRRLRKLKKQQEANKNNSSDRLKSDPETDLYIPDHKKEGVSNPLFETEDHSEEKRVQNPLFREDDEDSIPTPSKQVDTVLIDV